MKAGAISYLVRDRSGAAILSRAGLVTGAEMVNRLTRIATAVALAWSMGVAEFGIAMAALTVHELVRMFIQNGLGTRIVTAADHEVEAVARTVHRLNCWLGLALAGIQVAVAGVASLAYGAHGLAAAVLALALVHVIYPWAMVQVYLAQRTDRWAVVSFAIAAQAAFDNLLTAAFAIAGFGIWAVVIPKLGVAVGWVVFHRAVTPWRPSLGPCAEARDLICYGGKVMATEALACLRAHGDKAVVGFWLGPAALGLYAFAANIGKGFTLSLSQALGAVILPHLRRSRDRGQLGRTHVETLLIMTFAVAPVALLQAVCADWLVPLLFGEKWQPAAGFVAILALASISQPLITATSQMLRADDRPGADLIAGVTVTIVVFASLAAALPYGLAAAVAAMAIAQVVAAFGVAVLGFFASASGRTRSKPVEACS